VLQEDEARALIGRVGRDADPWIATAGPGATIADRPEALIGASLAGCLGSKPRAWTSS
jgi:hypothetical protein